MRIGPFIRKYLGSREKQITQMYREFFFDFSIFIEKLGELNPRSILEIGCGEGLIADNIMRRLPNTYYLGIDVFPHVGRLYERKCNNVEFKNISLFDIDQSKHYELVFFCDVLHHINMSEHLKYIKCAWELVSPGGVFLIKDWSNDKGLINTLAYLSDRYITGDKVTYFDVTYFIELIKMGCDASSSLDIEKLHFRPYHNNFCLIKKKVCI